MIHGTPDLNATWSWSRIVRDYNKCYSGVPIFRRLRPMSLSMRLFDFSILYFFRHLRVLVTQTAIWVLREWSRSRPMTDLANFFLFFLLWMKERHAWCWSALMVMLNKWMFLGSRPTSGWRNAIADYASFYEPYARWTIIESTHSSIPSSEQLFDGESHGLLRKLGRFGGSWWLMRKSWQRSCSDLAVLFDFDLATTSSSEGHTEMTDMKHHETLFWGFWT